MTRTGVPVSSRNSANRFRPFRDKDRPVAVLDTATAIQLNMSNPMESTMYPQSTPGLARKRRELAPAVANAFKAFSDAVFADGALPSATKEFDRGRRRARHAVSVLHQGPHA